MARLVTPMTRLSDRMPEHRFVFDPEALRAHFDATNDKKHLNVLLVQFGLPRVPKLDTHMQYGGGHWPLFLELAERMDRPLDLSKLVLQAR